MGFTCIGTNQLDRSTTMDDDDGMMLNFSASSKATPQKNKSKSSSTPSQPRSTTSHESSTATDAPRGRIMHGKAQVISSIFSSNPNVRLPKSARVVKTSEKSTVPSNAPVADSTTFIGLGIESDLVNLLKERIHVTTPTNVQRKAIPLLLGPTRNVRDAEILEHDVDAVIQAETGSGKTLTYLLPIINRLLETSVRPDDNEQPQRDRNIGTLALILTPTHELALQVANVAEKLVNFPKSYSRPHWIVPGQITGGINKAKEKARLKKGITILVATPGRLLDHLLHTSNFSIANLKWLVLDEADRLLDLGFEDTLKQIMDILKTKTRASNASSDFWPHSRQTVLCSATLREDVKQFAGETLMRPVFVSGNDKVDDQEKEEQEEEETKYAAPSQLKQQYAMVSAKLRLVSLVTLLRSSFFNKRSGTKPARKIIVFVSSIGSVNFHFNLLAHGDRTLEDEDDEDDIMDEDGDDDKKKKKEKPIKICERSSLVGNIPLYRLHGDMKQNERKETYQSFCKATNGIMLCTDVAARGLDMPHVDHIIQYDAPVDLRDYVHRAGRTARLGQAGSATIFLLPSELEYADMLKAQGMTVAPLDIQSVLKFLGNESKKGDYQDVAQNLQNKMEEYVLRSEEVNLHIYK